MKSTKSNTLGTASTAITKAMRVGARGHGGLFIVAGT
jgi:hypothetical protein